MDVIADIEDALVAHWSLFGRWPRGALHDEDGLLWYETPITHLPYNGVIRTHLDGAADPAIAAVVERFRGRGAECLWFDHPTATPSDLGERLPAHGLQPVEQITCMSLDLSGFQPAPLPDGITYQPVTDEASLHTYSDLTMRYWDIPAGERDVVEELQRELGPGRAPGYRYLALGADGTAIGKGYLSLAGPAGVAAIYGMSVRPEARGRGVAAGMTATLLERARQRGCTRAVLHSTPTAVGLYRRVGFVERCSLTVFATASLWSGDHH